MSDPSRTETQPIPVQLRLVVWADNELKRVGHNPYLIELLREAAAEVARLQHENAAHRAQEERIKGLEQERDDWKLSFETANNIVGVLEEREAAIIAKQQRFLERAEQAKAREQATREKVLAEAIEACEKVRARWSFHSVAPTAAYECIELIKTLRALPAAGAAAASPKENNDGTR